MNPTRTPTQNKALHLYFELVAESLNDAGLDVKSVVEHQMSIPWSKFLVKELLWRRAQDKFLNKRSTADLDTKEIDKVYDVVNRFLAGLGVDHIPFPSQEQVNERKITDR